MWIRRPELRSFTSRLGTTVITIVHTALDLYFQLDHHTLGPNELSPGAVSSLMQICCLISVYGNQRAHPVCSYCTAEKYCAATEHTCAGCLKALVCWQRKATPPVLAQGNVASLNNFPLS